MSWDPFILETVDDAAAVRPALGRLFAQQRESFAIFAAGEAALDEVRSRDLVDDGARVLVQANPGRIKSTHAKTDAASVAERPCFLCPQNIPAAERGVAFGDLMLLPNPYPILRRHCTVALRDHIPQAIAGRVEMLLSLTRALGPDMLAFYNGPRCGASAPDHFHFQACDAGAVPLLAEVVTMETGPITSFGRRCLLLADSDAGAARERLAAALAVLARLEPGDEEPMVNIVSLYRDGRYQVLLFPRAVHRPSHYFAEGNARIAVTPGLLEMAGVLVVAEPEHFERLDAGITRSIFDEVSIEGSRFSRLLEELT